MKIEIVYALPHEQELKTLITADDCTVEQAIMQSGILQQYSDLSLENLVVGIFSKPVSLQQKLRNGDRIEIYRPLTIDPKEARRLRGKA